ncbi:hypothetical protein GCM10010992_26190 [Cloacibacterium rupense]|uniref:DUF5683 domain-containing protein n=1 Tax=Cloacibacterium rupense TaxID=517423 RepID=A0ABQ2NLH6_9FLAO|nr:DUF5683 domain-containing protein [Cloacibacterium rupense]GGP06387.1 hypothetical protein GCM10010992_26190 [Cloacibacterium rupense]
MRTVLSALLVLFFGFYFSQEIKPLDTIKTEKQVVEDIEKANAKALPKYNPTKAGLYSAVLPGLGQYYNKKYWKIPIVWGAIGTGVGVIVYNDKQYKRYRTAYIAELNGQDHEFSNIPGIDKTVLGNTQDNAKRYRDYSIAITGLVYILGIVDAVVDAHLYEQKHDPDLALKPTIINDNIGIGQAKAGLSLSYRF